MKKIFINKETIDYNDISELKEVFGEYVSIGEHVSIGEYVSIGNNVTLGDDVTLGDSARIGDNVRLGIDAIIGEYAIIGNNVTLGADVTLGNYVKLGDDVIIGDNVRLESNVKLGNNVKLEEGVKILTIYDGYKYIAHAVPDTNAFKIRMGCHTRTVEDWRELFYDTDEFKRGTKDMDDRLRTINYILVTYGYEEIV